MPESSSDRVLRQHRLTHLPRLSVSDDLLRARFALGCATSRCDATCCRTGVWVDLREREAILAHAERIQSCMDSDQDNDPAQWFQEEIDDSDFPSGRAIGTQVRARGCVFLNSAGRCVLQSVEELGGLDHPRLKPFYCYAYPITILDGLLTLSDSAEHNRPQCCLPVAQGELTVFEVCSIELEFVLGEAGARELGAMRREL